MDPTEILKLINDELDYVSKTNEPSTVIDGYVDDLADWLGKGGFSPDWDKYPLARSYYFTRRATVLRERSQE